MEVLFLIFYYYWSKDFHSLHRGLRYIEVIEVALYCYFLCKVVTVTCIKVSKGIPQKGNVQLSLGCATATNANNSTNEPELEAILEMLPRADTYSRTSVVGKTKFSLIN